MKYYKILNKNRESCHGGECKWAYRKWMPHIDNIEACRRGYHVCREQDLVYWLNEAIWEVEIKGETIELDDKVVASDARLVRKIKAWNEKAARLFACDCAEHVLKYARKQDRATLENTIAVARRFANGKATKDELADARDAAWAAARAAARDAAWASARAAARDAAWAALAAARDALAAERKWQTDRLMVYLRGEA